MCVIVGGFVGALFTSSHHLVFGPPTRSASSSRPRFFLSRRGLAPTEIALLLAFLIGTFQLAAGLAQLGKVTPIHLPLRHHRLQHGDRFAAGRGPDAEPAGHPGR